MDRKVNVVESKLIVEDMELERRFQNLYIMLCIEKFLRNMYLYSDMVGYGIY